MPPVSAPQEISFAMAAGVVAVVLVGGAVTLWARYGTAVFFETIAAGLSACF